MKITDFMPIHDSDMDGKPDTNPAVPLELHRIVMCTAGSVEMRCDYEPRHDYARAVPVFRQLRSNGTAVETTGGRQSMMLLSSASLPVSADGVKGEFALSQGESAIFVLAYGNGRPASLDLYRTQEKFQLTRRYWQYLVAGMNYGGLWRERVVRSFLVLHLMMYRGTGAIVAAPTTSLPETLGGSRNWDYRYSWLRDTSFTVDILYRRWAQTAFVIKTEALDLGWSESKRAFRQRYDSDALDASNLAIPFFGFIPPPKTRGCGRTSTPSSGNWPMGR